MFAARRGLVRALAAGRPEPLAAWLETHRLQQDDLVWLHRQKMFGWWEPSRLMRIKGGLWVTFWTHLLRPFLRSTVGRQQAQKSWKELYERDVKYLDGLNQFKNLARNY